MSLATSLRSSSWRTSTNSLRVAHLELHNFSIKSLIALTPGFLFSVSNTWMAWLVIPHPWATCFQLFWIGEESESSCRIESSTSYGKSASLKSYITKEQSNWQSQKEKKVTIIIIIIIITIMLILGHPVGSCPLTPRRRIGTAGGNRE